MNFDRLPNHMRLDIARNKRDIEDDLKNLRGADLIYLNSLTEEELFDAYLTWHGIIGFSSSIHEAHNYIYGGK